MSLRLSISNSDENGNVVVSGDRGLFGFNKAVHIDDPRITAILDAVIDIETDGLVKGAVPVERLVRPNPPPRRRPTLTQRIVLRLWGS